MLMGDGDRNRREENVSRPRALLGVPLALIATLGLGPGTAFATYTDDHYINR